MSETYFTTDAIRVIDADSHLTEPAELWVDHAPAALRDRVPRVVEDENGHPHWMVEGKVIGNVSFTSIGPDGSRIHGETFAMPLRFEDVHKGSYDFRARLDWLDEHGIDQQVIFPNLAGFGADQFALNIGDEGLRTACIGIYNDAVAEIQQESGSRFLPLGLVPWWDLEATVKELGRLRNTLGLRGITMSDAPEKLGLPYLDAPHWEPFWSACEDLDLAVAFHIGSGSFGRAVWSLADAGAMTGELLATQTSISFTSNSAIVANLIFSGVLLKHPRLKIFSAETGIGWLPFLIETMDYQWHENIVPEVRREVWKQMLPSEIFRRNFFVSFWFEQFGPRYAIDAIGEDNVMFETDFPHGTALTDRVHGDVVETLASLRPDVRRKVLHDNAARLYSL